MSLLLELARMALPPPLSRPALTRRVRHAS